MGEQIAYPDQDRSELYSQAGRCAVVTGGGAGIGLGIARAFVRHGAHVLIVGRDRGRLETAARSLQERCDEGQLVETFAADMSDPAQIEALFAELPRLLPALDVFVANAGIGYVTPLLDLELDEWRRTLDLNLTGTFLCCRNAARVMRDGGRSSPAIVVVGSIRGSGARPGRIAYSTTKAGLNQFVRVAALELAEHGIRINALCPGITETPLSLSNPEVLAAATRQVPFGRAANIDELGEAAVFLCSAASGFMTGAQLVLDGGESLW